MKMAWRKWHRGMAVSVGFLFIVWITSGVVMVLPQLKVSSLAPAQVGLQSQTLLDLRTSPAEAIEAVNRMRLKTVEVTNVQLRPVGTTILYEIATGDETSFLVDARTGEVVTVTDQLAQVIARTMLADGMHIESSALVSAYDADYRSGPLPVYRFNMSDAYGSVIYVSAHNGASRYTNRWLRIRGAIEGLHSFDPVEWATGSSLLRKGLLLLGSLGAGMVAFTGFALARRRA